MTRINHQPFSLIVRRYGIVLAAPWLIVTPVPGMNAVQPDAVAIHARALPFDPHLDIDTTFDGPGRLAITDGTTQFDLPKIRRGGIKAVGLAIFVPQDTETADYLTRARSVADAKYRIIVGLAAHYPDKVAIAVSPADVRHIAGQGKLAIVETVVNGGAFIRSLDDLDLWQKRGVRIFGFVHAGHNRLADSSRPAVTRGETSSRNGGLSPLGKQAVERLNRLGILIDVSQLSDAAFDDVLRLTKAPVIATHSDVRSLVANDRNLSDAQLDALKANGGVIAINAFSAYLRPQSAQTTAKIEALQHDFGIGTGPSVVLPPAQLTDYTKRLHDILASEPRATVKDLVDAIDYAVKRIGIAHVAISSDFNHGGGIIGWTNEGDAGNVTAELLRHGYTETQIDRLWSGNLLRVWAQAEAAGDGRTLRL